MRLFGFQYDDGGRSAAGFQGKAGDCFCRALAISTGRPYEVIYKEINEFAKNERRDRRSSARDGVYKDTARRFMDLLGFSWVPTMFLGKGCTVHVRPDELPVETLVLRVSKHFTVVRDGTIHDTFDPSRGGTRCVYGYWILTERVSVKDQA